MKLFGLLYYIIIYKSNLLASMWRSGNGVVLRLCRQGYNPW